MGAELSIPPALPIACIRLWACGVAVRASDGCSSDGGRARPAKDFRMAYTDRILSRAGVRARRERSPHLLRRRDVARDLLLRETCVYLSSAVRWSCDANK